MHNPFEPPIFITKPFLPPIEEFLEGIKEIWDSAYLTNNGPFLQKFREMLARKLELDHTHCSLLGNGTLALILGIRAMRLSGEIITTPFSFPATSHAICWNNIKPIFVDIEPDYFTIDPEAVERAITPDTSAILAVHVYGYPCKLKELQNIADKYNLRLLYDAAHAFGVTIDNMPISSYGDMSMFSFHATKAFHSVEGGLLTFKDSRLVDTVDLLKNFGIKDETDIVLTGINAKMNEFQALMGILSLKHFNDVIAKRKIIYDYYYDKLININGIILPPPLPYNVTPNFSYFPIIVSPIDYGINRDDLYNILRKYNIYARKYFYPLLSDISSYNNISQYDPLSNARFVSCNILTLPIYPDLSLDHVDIICNIINDHYSS